MLETAQNWELFGYDMRQLGKHWLAAWRSVFWADDSPVRKHLDDVVCLYSLNGSKLYQAGKPCSPAPFECEAILLPDDLALIRAVRMPLSVESDLELALTLEVNANSPFSADDTGYGWRVVSRNETHLQLALVIVSMSAVMGYLGRQYDIHDPQGREIWVDVNGDMVLVRGFGEYKREAKYTKRLRRCGVMIAICAVLVLVLAGVAAGFKRAQLLQLEALFSSTQREAAQASSMRESLARGNDVIGAANKVAALHPNPHYEIARLTKLLGDGAYILQFAMSGTEIRLRGRATDAATVMQKLTNEAAYTEVTAPQAIVKVGNAGLEQFSLNINLDSGASG